MKHLTLAHDDDDDNDDDKDVTWKIIPDTKWLVTPIYKPFRPFVRGTTLPRGLANHGY